LSGGENPPLWNLGAVTSAHDSHTPDVVARYRELRDKTENW